MAFPASPTNGQVYTTSDGRTYKYTLTGSLWDFQGFVNTSPKSNLAATATPTSTADSASGYGIGSIWVDVVANKSYTCVDATAGAAIWSAGGGGGATVAATFPLSPALGDLFQNTVTDKLYVWVGSSWIDIVAGGAGPAKTNLSATVDPLATDSAVGGYSEGSIWINAVSNNAFICVDSAAGAAIWTRMSSNSLSWKIVTTATTAVANDGLMVDTTLSPITVTLPTAPVLGQKVGIMDATGSFATNNLTIARAGSKIMGLAADMIISTNNTSFTLVSTNAFDWRILH